MIDKNGKLIGIIKNFGLNMEAISEMNMANLQQCTPPPGTSLPGGLFTSISFEEPEKGVIESFTTKYH